MIQYGIKQNIWTNGLPCIATKDINSVRMASEITYIKGQEISLPAKSG